MMTNVVIQRFLIEVACVDLHSEIPSLKVDIRCGSGSEKKIMLFFKTVGFLCTNVLLSLSYFFRKGRDFMTFSRLSSRLDALPHHLLAI